MTQVELRQEKLLILGCGDIGLRLARLLSAECYSIVGVRRQIQHHDLPYFNYLACDLFQESAMKKILMEVQPDVLVITMTPTERSDAGYEQAYVQICQQLINHLQLLNQPPRLILFVSSTSVYAQDDGSWVDEFSLTEPKSFSGKRLLQAENILQNSGYPVTVVRFSGIYGPGRERLINQVKSGNISSSSGFTNRLHADDCARVLAHLIEKQKTQSLDHLYLASDDCPVPMCEIQHWIAEQLGLKSMSTSDIETERGNKKINNQRLKQTGFRFVYSDYRQGYAALIKKTGLMN